MFLLRSNKFYFNIYTQNEYISKLSLIIKAFVIFKQKQGMQVQGLLFFSEYIDLIFFKDFD